MRCNAMHCIRKDVLSARANATPIDCVILPIVCAKFKLVIRRLIVFDTMARTRPGPLAWNLIGPKQPSNALRNDDDGASVDP